MIIGLPRLSCLRPDSDTLDAHDVEAVDVDDVDDNVVVEDGCFCDDVCVE